MLPLAVALDFVPPHRRRAHVPHQVPALASCVGPGNERRVRRGGRAHHVGLGLPLLQRRHVQLASSSTGAQSQHHLVAKLAIEIGNARDYLRGLAPGGTPGVGHCELGPHQTALAVARIGAHQLHSADAELPPGIGPGLGDERQAGDDGAAAPVLDNRDAAGRHGRVWPQQQVSRPDGDAFVGLGRALVPVQVGIKGGQGFGIGRAGSAQHQPLAQVADDLLPSHSRPPVRSSPPGNNRHTVGLVCGRHPCPA